ncbi:MAG TPA: sulfotransferase domain-containing protein [Caldilineaceae bacterium]|nr:sulfotransferase domain-containing protein [Caldilineaceae bacterium]
MLVDFMMIGAQKCGTTSLATQLAAHPEISFCRNKEPGYFNRVQDWRSGLDGYHALYEPQPGQLCGEASTMYTFLPEYEATHRRLYEYNSQLKLIYIMRDPIERMISHYSHNLVRGLVHDTPEIALANDPTYRDRSRYAMQIAPYLDLFGRDQILLLVFEEYIVDQAATLQTIARFLGISEKMDTASEETVVHKTVGEYYLKYTAIEEMVKSGFFQAVRPYIPEVLRKGVRRRLSNKLDDKPTFPAELQAQLQVDLAPDVAKIEELLGRPIVGWRAYGPQTVAQHEVYTHG